MKTLLAEWNKHLSLFEQTQYQYSDNPIISHNVSAILKHFPSDELRSVKYIVNNIEPLTTNKITGFLGSGGFGRVYKLNNDHALKIYRSDTSSGEEMISAAKNKKQKDLTGQEDLIIFDHGNIDNEIFWHEIPVVIPLDSFLIGTKRADKSNIESIMTAFAGSFQIIYVILSIMRKNSNHKDKILLLLNKNYDKNNFYRLTEFVKKHYMDDYLTHLNGGEPMPSVNLPSYRQHFIGYIDRSMELMNKTLTDEEFINVGKAYSSLIKRGFEPNDAKMQNMGIYPSTHKVVIFDT